MSKKLIATILIVAHIEGKRTEIKPGEEVKGLSDHDVAQLKRLGSLRDMDEEQADAQADADKRAAADKLFDEARAKVAAAHASTLPAAVQAEKPEPDVPAADATTGPAAAANDAQAKPPKKGKPRQDQELDAAAATDGDATTAT